MPAARLVAVSMTLLALLPGTLEAGPNGDSDARSYQKKATWVETLFHCRELIRSASVDPGRRSGLAELREDLWERALEDFPCPTDWLLQDHANDPRDWERQDREARAERGMIERVLGELGDAGEVFRQEYEKLLAASPTTHDPRWLELYERACQRRREARLEGLIARWPRIVFTKNHTVQPSFFAYTEGQSDAQNERHFTPGTALCLLHWDGHHGKVRTLIDDPRGRIRDPDVSWDGQRILFAWKKSDRKDDYHLHEMEVASGEIRQLTFGLGFADYEGKYLPNDDIIFASTRCVQTVDCWWTEVSNLYLCDRDGNYLRRVGYDQVHTISPSVLGDGTVIYTRWDYNDRGQVYPQGLFRMNPDGTGQTEFYGNNSWFPTTISHARGIPGSRKVIATAHGHHTWQAGELILVDVANGRQEASGVQLIAPVRETRAVRIDRYGQEGDLFQYPYPISEREFLVGYSPLGGESRRFAIYFMTENARRELLVRDASLSSNHPVPLAARQRPHVRPSIVDYRKETGTFFLQDIHVGPGLEGIPHGTVAKLRVVALRFRAAGVKSNRSRGEAGGALISTPISVGNGCWDVKEVLGEAAVYEDGSACFEVPSRTPVYFQAVDHDGYVVQTMRSWATLMPGESFSCVGCHEDKDTVPAAAGKTIAAARGPRPLEPFYGSPRGFSFPREIQPILDRHCVDCHDGREALPPGTSRGEPVGSTEEKHAFSLLGTLNVDGAAGRRWSDAYLNLTGAIGPEGASGNPDGRLVNWISAQSRPSMLPPYYRGSARSELLRLLRDNHHDVRLSREEREKIACWIDLGVPYCGDYTEANAWNESEKARYARFQAKRDRMKAMEERNVRALIEATRSPPPGPPHGQTPR